MSQMETSNMIIKEAKVLYNAKGRKTHVLLPYKRYIDLLERLGDLADSNAMDEAISDEPSIPWEEAKMMIHKKGR